MTRITTGDSSVDSKWVSAGAGSRYRDARWRSTRARERDPRIVSRLLTRFSSERSQAGVLDVPCGSGRLRDAICAQDRICTGVDVSQEMLTTHIQDRVVRSSVWQLPFRDDTFDAVVCSRLLHHLADPAAADAALAELVRVSRELVIASFWDAGSWHAWRRRRGLRRGRRDARVAVEKDQLEARVERAGADVVGYEHTFRYVSQQTFFAARKRR
ncbi:MAG: methyltransferase domain-containing protein [bacterium]|nr:methyltransferase domain-containing protein [bacterium]